MRGRRGDPPIPTAGRVLALDVGDVRVGTAITDPSQLVATPSETLRVDGLLGDLDDAVDLSGLDGDPDDPSSDAGVACLAAALAGVADRHDAVGLVVGLPKNLDGREGRAARDARRLGDAIGSASGLPVVYLDERFSSVEANRVLASTGRDSRARRERTDEVAASLLLDTWLMSRR